MLRALNATTGAPVWNVTAGNYFSSSPAFANDAVYVGNGDGNVYALDAKTGTVMWTWPTGGVIIDSPAIANGVLYIESEDGKLYALDISHSSPRPVVDFHGMPTSGTAPLDVQFNDTSTGSPTGWAWYFGDEAYTQVWTQQTSGAAWSARGEFNSVALPDGSIVLMGGQDNNGNTNDVWRSTDGGVTWTQQTAGAAWSARNRQSSVALPDGSIVLMGGFDTWFQNDVWRSTDNGTTWTEQTVSPGWWGRYGQSSVALPDGSIVLMGGFNNSYQNDTWRSIDNGTTWTEQTAHAGWSGRWGQSSVALPDGSIVLMGGSDSGGILLNDTWRSTDQGATWTQQTAQAGWSGRRVHSSVALPDGSILLMSGMDNTFGYLNDTWRSTDQGATWTQLPAAGWPGREDQSSVALRDGSIMLMGGGNSGGYLNDTWRFMPAGSSAPNPSHTYTTSGSYKVSLQAYNSGGYNSTRKAGYITVTGAPVNNTIINQSATIFIGEEGLNITHALNQAQGSPMDGTPPLATIGWWAPVC